MKKLIASLLLIPTLALAQLHPIIGFRYTGGLSYDQDHEYFSLETGFMYRIGEFQNTNFLLSDEVSLSYEFVYDSPKVFTDGRNANLYAIRFKTSKYFTDILALTSGVSYLNTYRSPNISPNFGYNFGVAFIDYNISASLNYERINGYGYGTLEINFKLWEIF